MSDTPWWEGHPYADVEAIEREYLKAKAEFLVALNGVVTWSEYDNLTYKEINALVDALNKRAREANRK